MQLFSNSSEIKKTFYVLNSEGSHCLHCWKFWK